MKHLFISIGLFASIVTFAQKVSNKINFTKGQKIEVVTNMNITAQSAMGPSSGTFVITDNYNVNDASPAAATLQKVPKQIKIDFSMGSQQIKMDSDNPRDLNGMLGDPVKEIMNQKPEFVVDASGKIVSVKQDATKKKADKQENNIMGMMLPGLDLSASLPQAGNASVFQILPGREVGVGDTWTDSIDVDGNKNVTNYKVREITDKEIIVDFAGTGATANSQEAMGMKVKVNASTKATGNVVIDKASGIMKQRTSTNNTETTMNLGGQEITSNLKTTTVTNVTVQ